MQPGHHRDERAAHYHMTYMKTVIDGLRRPAWGTSRWRWGAPISQMFADEIGADGYGANASAAVDLFLRLAASRKQDGDLQNSVLAGIPAQIKAEDDADDVTVELPRIHGAHRSAGRPAGPASVRRLSGAMAMERGRGTRGLGARGGRSGASRTRSTGHLVTLESCSDPHHQRTRHRGQPHGIDFRSRRTWRPRPIPATSRQVPGVYGRGHRGRRASVGSHRRRAAPQRQVPASRAAPTWRRRAARFVATPCGAEHARRNGVSGSPRGTARRPYRSGGGS